MKLKEYAKHIAQLAKHHPHVEVICSGDEEGNHFFPQHFGPDVGHYKDGEFKSQTETLAENGNGDGGIVNAICLN